MDASVGLIMQKLRDLGLDNNTLVIFTRYCSTNSVLVWVCERVSVSMTRCSMPDTHPVSCLGKCYMCYSALQSELAVTHSEHLFNTSGGNVTVALEFRASYVTSPRARPL